MGEVCKNTRSIPILPPSPSLFMSRKNRHAKKSNFELVCKRTWPCKRRKSGKKSCVRWRIKRVWNEVVWLLVVLRPTMPSRTTTIVNWTNPLMLRRVKTPKWKNPKNKWRLVNARDCVWNENVNERRKCEWKRVWKQKRGDWKKSAMSRKRLPLGCTQGRVVWQAKWIHVFTINRVALIPDLVQRMTTIRTASLSLNDNTPRLRLRFTAPRVVNPIMPTLTNNTINSRPELLPSLLLTRDLRVPREAWICRQVRVQHRYNSKRANPSK
mmetsp:Transcript_12702/g.24142  ORF Transcript_12702/g.24142 Transcript_12702/m.24142 type:complete len:268 (-) Transcript_12702:47-850(-)